MAIINDKLVSIGGLKNNWLKMVDTPTKSLLTYSKSWLGMKWERLLPPMPTERILPAAVVTPSHLVVAGGKTVLDDENSCLSTIAVMNLQKPQQWCQVSSLPRVVYYPQLALCQNILFLSDDNSVFSCSVDDILQPQSNSANSVWSKCADIPVKSDQIRWPFSGYGW